MLDNESIVGNWWQVQLSVIFILCVHIKIIITKLYHFNSFT